MGRLGLDVSWAGKLTRDFRSIVERPGPCDCIIVQDRPVLPDADTRSRFPSCPHRAAWAIAWRPGCEHPPYTSAVICDDCKTALTGTVIGCTECSAEVRITYIEPLGR